MRRKKTADIKSKNNEKNIINNQKTEIKTTEESIDNHTVEKAASETAPAPMKFQM